MIITKMALPRRTFLKGVGADVHRAALDHLLRTRGEFFHALEIVDGKAYLGSSVELPGYANGVQVKDGVAWMMTQESGLTFPASSFPGSGPWCTTAKRRPGPWNCTKR